MAAESEIPFGWHEDNVRLVKRNGITKDVQYEMAYFRLGVGQKSLEFERIRTHWITIIERLSSRIFSDLEKISERVSVEA